MTAAESLVSACEDFARTLDGIVGGTLGPDVPSFEVVVGSGPECRIGPGPLAVANGQFSFVPLVRSCDDPARPTVFLRAVFTCAMDPEGDFMAVSSSTFGLFVKVHATKGPRPIVRVEYERHQYPDTPNCHVHLHAVSQELGWLRGSAGQPFSELQDLHFPIGGRRFRPTLEEFLMFLHRERLFMDWASPNWRSVLKESQTGWEERQAKATVRRHLPAVLDYLRAQGFGITEPQSRTGDASA